MNLNYNVRWKRIMYPLPGDVKSQGHLLAALRLV